MKKPLILLMLIAASTCWAAGKNERLQHALENHQDEAAIEAVKDGADPNVTVEDDGKHYPAIVIAAEEGDLQLAEVLIKHGADINRSDSKGFDAIAYALCKGGSERIEIAELLLENGARLDRKYMKSYSLAELIREKCGRDGKEFIRKHGIR